MERPRCRRRALVHARQVRASPSGELDEPLNATADNRLPQVGQVFLVIMSV